MNCKYYVPLTQDNKVMYLIFYSLVVTVRNTRCNTKKTFNSLTQFIYVICVNLTLNIDYFHIQHEPTGLYDGRALCYL
jgi:hypothetical protein